MRSLTFGTLAVLLCFLLLRKTHFILTAGLLPETLLHGVSIFIHLMVLLRQLWAWLLVLAINTLSLLLTLILLFTQNYDQVLLSGIVLENLLMLTLLLVNYKHFFTDIVQGAANIMPAYELKRVDLLPYPGRNNLARKDHDD